MTWTAESCAAFLYQEAAMLDAQRWDDWLALYTADCEFWLPAWKSEHELTANPRAELSLIYYRTRAGLEDRVSRVKSGKSVASIPLPRTQHSIANVRIEPAADGSVQVYSNWVVNEFLTKSREVRMQFGRYEHRLTENAGEKRISRKKIVMLNDYMPAALDFYDI
ncbi:MAG TPA: aromatic-ring-hydroxylating dioxygenase subunit beta [Ramlibacter sp.]|uniref:aromatic-ring-hydroxylating dioxygenase subunit beta n=1 Tax=Ramlibacter sp. TaxID=1917967 RepID=UPI002CCCF4CA|nr:aromatic-ring-hydroxylating dioxygenase subunit beta [Ramlibacter sp.]HVZ46541.1 aromatic-ring-hydroxylating dioxygenase subunit beta [Ramlibacter sp.]